LCEESYRGKDIFFLEISQNFFYFLALLQNNIYSVDLCDFLLFWRFFGDLEGYFVKYFARSLKPLVKTHQIMKPFLKRAIFLPVSMGGYIGPLEKPS
jgi:hypothetical protein